MASPWSPDGGIEEEEEDYDGGAAANERSNNNQLVVSSVPATRKRPRSKGKGVAAEGESSGLHERSNEPVAAESEATPQAADIILWKCRRVNVGVIFGATMAWWLFEKSELSFLTICCDVLLILTIVQFMRVKISGLLNKQPRPLPELVLSEEMVSNAAASFRVEVNNMLMIAHDITLGKDFRLFFQVVSVLWLLSVVGNFYSSITLAYIGTIALVTVPALYHRHQEHFDWYAGMVHRNISRHYKIVDENVKKLYQR